MSDASLSFTGSATLSSDISEKCSVASEPFREAYQTLYDLYREQGLSDAEIDTLLVLDIKGKDYFDGTPITYQHGGGYLFCRDKEIMGWLFNRIKPVFNITET